MVVYSVKRIEQRCVSSLPLIPYLSSQCDEVIPRCGRCQRIGSECSLQDQTSDQMLIPVERRDPQKGQANIAPVEIRSGSSGLSYGHTIYSSEGLRPRATSTANPELSIVESRFSEIERERLKLMNHYTLHTSKSITEITVPQGQDQSLWSPWVTDLAFENEYLLHGLLSLSALHFALRSISPQKYTIMAIHHHTLGMTLFRPRIPDAMATNFDAGFAFSCLVALYSFGIQRVSKSEADPLAKARQVLLLVRQSAYIAKSNHEAMERSRWYALMLPFPIQLTQKFPDGIESMLSTLLQRASTTMSAPIQRDVYVPAIEMLRENFKIAITNRSASLTMTLFPIMSPFSFWTMVETGDPLALAILANYAVILYWIRSNIWMEGWGKETIQAVRQALPPEWHDCIAWAIRETGLA